MKKSEIIATIAMLPLLWVAGTSLVQKFKCPQLTETQVILEVPNSFFLDFKKCE